MMRTLRFDNLSKKDYSLRPCNSPFGPSCVARCSKSVPDDFVDVGAKRRRPAGVSNRPKAIRNQSHKSSNIESFLKAPVFYFPNPSSHSP